MATSGMQGNGRNYGIRKKFKDNIAPYVEGMVTLRMNSAIEEANRVN